MTKKQIVSEILELSRELDAREDYTNSDTLVRIASKIATDLVKEEELEASRRGNPDVPQNEQLEDLRSGVIEDTHEVRLESKRGKK